MNIITIYNQQNQWFLVKTYKSIYIYIISNIYNTSIKINDFTYFNLKIIYYDYSFQNNWHKMISKYDEYIILSR